MDESPNHPHNRSRNTFIEINGVTQPAPAPRFSRTTLATPTAPCAQGDGATVLADWGFGADEITGLRALGAL